MGKSLQLRVSTFSSTYITPMVINCWDAKRDLS